MHIKAVEAVEILHLITSDSTFTSASIQLRSLVQGIFYKIIFPCTVYRKSYRLSNSCII